jgi:transposase
MPPHQISHDLKARIPVLRLEFRFSVKEICKILDICKSLVYTTLQYYNLHSTSFNPHAQSTFGWRKLTQVDLALICDMIAQQHSVYLDKIQEELFARRGKLVSIPTIVRTLCRLDFSHKKVTVGAIECNEITRAAFMNRIGTDVFDPAMLMFTDETSKDERTSS